MRDIFGFASRNQITGMFFVVSDVGLKTHQHNRHVVVGEMFSFLEPVVRDRLQTGGVVDRETDQYHVNVVGLVLHQRTGAGVPDVEGDVLSIDLFDGRERLINGSMVVLLHRSISLSQRLIYAHYITLLYAIAYASVYITSVIYLSISPTVKYTTLDRILFNV